MQLCFPLSLAFFDLDCVGFILVPADLFVTDCEVRPNITSISWFDNPTNTPFRPSPSPSSINDGGVKDLGSGNAAANNDHALAASWDTNEARTAQGVVPSSSPCVDMINQGPGSMTLDTMSCCMEWSAW